VISTSFYKQVSSNGVLAQAGKTPYGPVSSALDIQISNLQALSSTTPPVQELITAKSVGGSFTDAPVQTKTLIPGPNLGAQEAFLAQLAPSNDLTPDQQMQLRKQAFGVTTPPQEVPTALQQAYLQAYTSIQINSKDLTIVKSIPLPTTPQPSKASSTDPLTSTKDKASSSAQALGLPGAKGLGAASSAAPVNYVYQPVALGPTTPGGSSSLGVVLTPVASLANPKAGATFSVLV
jgi:hypothetical protein